MIAPLSYVVTLDNPDRIPEPVDITFATTDIDIYEHIDLPFLTATVILIDEMNFFERIDIIGGEKIKIDLKSGRGQAPQEDDTKVKNIIKDFIVTSVKATARGVDNRSQTIALSLIEDIGFNSNLKNLNKMYKGKCSDIINKIVPTLGRKVDTEAKDIQNLKVIIPNMSPLDACSWLNNRATTAEGYPFFFYSTLVDKNLQFNDLGTLLLDRQAVNEEKVDGEAPPFRYSKPLAQSTDPAALTVVSSYTHRDVENLYNIIMKGSIGSKQNFINSSGSKAISNQTFDFDVSKDTLDAFSAKLPGKQKRVLYDKKLNFNTEKSRVIAQFGGSNSHRTTKSRQFDLSYSECSNLADYKNTTKAAAYLDFMHKSPLVFSMNGIDFMDGNYNTTLGRKIRVEFLPTDQYDLESTVDSKLSGEYLIMGTQHVIKRERYDITFTGARFSNMEIPDPPPPATGKGAK